MKINIIKKRSILPEHEKIIRDLTKDSDISAEYLLNVALMESGGDPNAAAQNSSARGLYQITDATAKDLKLMPEDRFDVAKSTQAMINFTLKNKNLLRSALGREPSHFELYLAHQQGPKGAINLILAGDNKATTAVKKKAITNNAGSADMTANEFMKLIKDKFESKSFYQMDNTDVNRSSVSRQPSSYSPMNNNLPKFSYLGDHNQQVRFGSNIPSNVDRSFDESQYNTGIGIQGGEEFNSSDRFPYIQNNRWGSNIPIGGGMPAYDLSKAYDERSLMDWINKYQSYQQQYPSGSGAFPVVDYRRFFQ